MQRLEVNGAVRPIYGSLGVKRLRTGTAVPRPSMSRSSMLLLSSDILTGSPNHNRHHHRHSANICVCQYVYRK